MFGWSYLLGRIRNPLSTIGHGRYVMRSPKDRCSAHVRIHSVLIAVLLLLGVGLPWQEAFAELTFMVLNPDRVSTPGGTETFMGTITNDTDADLSSGDLFLNFSGFDP